MADVSITPANVVPDADGLRVERGYSYATITAGKAVKKNAAGLWILGNCLSATAETDVFGIALNGASSGQPLEVMLGGTLTIGGTVAAGVTYILSESGGICPDADGTTNDYKVTIGVGTSTAKIKLAIAVGGPSAKIA